MTSPRSEPKGRRSTRTPPTRCAARSRARAVFSVSSSRSVPEKRSVFVARRLACVARSSPHTPAAASSRRRIAVRNAEDQPIAYPSAATRAPTGGAPPRAARTSTGRRHFLSRLVARLVSTTSRCSKRSERRRPARRAPGPGGGARRRPTPRASARSPRRSRAHPRGCRDRRGTRRARRSARAGRRPRRPETPPPQTRAWTIAGTATASWPRAVLPRRSPRERTRARHLETMARVLRVSFASRRRFPRRSRAPPRTAGTEPDVAADDETRPPRGARDRDPRRGASETGTSRRRMATPPESAASRLFHGERTPERRRPPEAAPHPRARETETRPEAECYVAPTYRKHEDVLKVARRGARR